MVVLASPVPRDVAFRMSSSFSWSVQVVPFVALVGAFGALADTFQTSVDVDMAGVVFASPTCGNVAFSMSSSFSRWVQVVPFGALVAFGTLVDTFQAFVDVDMAEVVFASPVPRDVAFRMSSSFSWSVQVVTFVALSYASPPSRDVTLPRSWLSSPVPFRVVPVTGMEVVTGRPPVVLVPVTEIEVVTGSPTVVMSAVRPLLPPVW